MRLVYSAGGDHANIAAAPRVATLAAEVIAHLASLLGAAAVAPGPGECASASAKALESAHALFASSTGEDMGTVMRWPAVFALLCCVFCFVLFAVFLF
jgi:hypothetical protein